jgi:hypothetical protein
VPADERDLVPWYMPARLRGCYLAHRDRIEACVAASPPLEGDRLAAVVRLLRSSNPGVTRTVNAEAGPAPPDPATRTTTAAPSRGTTTHEHNPAA